MHREHELRVALPVDRAWALLVDALTDRRSPATSGLRPLELDEVEHRALIAVHGRDPSGTNLVSGEIAVRLEAEPGGTRLGLAGDIDPSTLAALARELEARASGGPRTAAGKESAASPRQDDAPATGAHARRLGLPALALAVGAFVAGWAVRSRLSS